MAGEGVLSKFTGIFKVFFKNLKFSFILLVLLVFVLHAIVISVQDKDPVTGINYLAEKFTKSTEDLNNQSLEILERGSIYIEGSTFFQKLFAYLKVYWILFATLTVIYMWLKVLSKIVMHVFLGNTSAVFPSYIIAFIMFILIQFAFLGLSNAHILWDAFINFGKAFPILLDPIFKLADKFG